MFAFVVPPHLHIIISKKILQQILFTLSFVLKTTNEEAL